VLKICVEDVSQVVKKQKIRKASGPDSSLAPIFIGAVLKVSCCFKCSTIILVPKIPKIT